MYGLSSNIFIQMILSSSCQKSSRKSLFEDVLSETIGTFPLCIGFLAAFLSGCFACKLMINLVKKGKLVYFGIYCAIVGASVLIYQLAR